jgi:hypothetical protein
MRRETLQRSKKSKSEVENLKSDIVRKKKSIIELPKEKEKEIKIKKDKQEEQKKIIIKLKDNKIPGNKKKENNEKENEKENKKDNGKENDNDKENDKKNEKDIDNKDKEINRGIIKKFK